MMNKPFKVADIHAWLKQVTEGQISYSRMVELMNDQSEAYHAAKYEQKQNLVELMKMDEEKDGELHPDSNNLLKHCFEELRLKMIKNQEKHRYSNEWLTHDWEQECRDHMMQHIEKGDPRDVAIYALFMMYRGWSTKSEPNTGEQCFTKEMIEDRFGFHATEKEVEWFNSKASQYATDRAKKVLEKVLLTKENWPLVDLLNKLLEAADILLHRKDYDGHGWEDIEHTAKRVKEYLKTIENPKNLEV